MLYFDQTSWLLVTGLSLEEIGKIALLDPDKWEESLGSLGEKYLRRYEIFKRYKEAVMLGELSEPIIPIVAGLPCTGKTVLSREIATRLGIGNVLGGDGIRASYRELIDKNKHPEFFTSIYGAWKFVGDKTETRENVILGFRKQAELMNSLMQRIISDRGIRDGESMIVEFLHFLPSQLDPEVLNNPSVMPFVLRVDSEDVHKGRIDTRDQTTHLKGRSARLLDALDNYRMMQDVQTDDAMLFGVPVISTDNFDDAFERILDSILERVSKLEVSQ